MQDPLMNSPIPGANFTSDTRNYPWHRPPDIVDFDEAVEFIAKGIMKPRPASGILTMLEMGVTVAMVTQMIIMAGMSRGKWTLDLGLVVAGPVARMIEMMADDAGIDYTMGTEEDTTPVVPPVNFMKIKEDQYDTPDQEDVTEVIEEIKAKGKPSIGFKPPKE
jgi:hypothetical protein